MLECIHDIIFEYKYKGGTIMVYIESPSTNPAFNLALEQYVFDRMDRSQEYFMLWQNDNTVVIGKNQNAFAEVNQKVADAKHISVVRRLSGGGAVYHDLGNLNFTFILDAKDATDLDIRLFCQPIAELLRSLNVPAEVNGRNDISICAGLEAGVCGDIQNGLRDICAGSLVPFRPFRCCRCAECFRR